MTTIKEVIGELDLVIEHCKKINSRQAYFASLYRAMTCSVDEAIGSEYFSEDARMEKLDVIFAGRYLDAWKSYQENRPCSISWKTAFDACEDSSLIVLQHLLLGINTHINLDLAIAAATTCPGETIFTLENDFEKINALIASLTNVVQARLEKIWWPMRFLERIGNGKEKSVINFSITAARKTSWANAVALATFQGDPSRYISGMDQMINNLSQKILAPGSFTKMMLSTVRRFEYTNVKQVIDVLNEPIPVK